MFKTWLINGVSKKFVYSHQSFVVVFQGCLPDMQIYILN